MQTYNMYLDGRLPFFPAFIFEMGVLTFIIFQRHKNDKEENQRLQILSNRNQLSIANRLIEGQETERQRISSDLHDNLGSLLSISKLYLSQIKIEKKRDIISLIESAQMKTRSISNSLMPKVLVSLGLIPAIVELSANLENEHFITIDLGHNNFSWNYSITQKVNIYRIVEELLYNSINISKAKNITLQVTEFDSSLNLILENDGPNTISFTSDLELRIKLLKGEVFLDKDPHHGNNLVLDLAL